MANAAIVHENLADAATLTASSAETLMPVSRLQNEHVGSRWRSTADPGYFTLDLGSDVSLDTLGLFGLTLATSGSIRVRMSGGNDQYTKVLLRMNGTDASTTFTDDNAGGSAHTWTAAGNAQIDTADKKFGTASGLFDGAGDWISTPDHADFALGSGDFTIEAWFKCNAPVGSARAIAGQGDATPTVSISSFIIRRETTGVMSFRYCTGTGIVTISGTTIFSNVDNTGWHHFAAVRSGTQIKMFIDGVQEGSTSNFAGSVPDSTEILTVGCRSSAFNDPWNGWIDEFRLSVGVARWTENFTPPTAPYDDSSGATGNVHDVTYTVADAELTPNRDGYGSLVLPLAAPVSARYVRFDLTDGVASYVEAGVPLVGLREAFTYNFAPGAGVTWVDRSRSSETAGGQTLTFRDNKYRTVEFNLEWVTAAQRYGVHETIARVNGTSRPVLLMLDTASDDLPRDSIFGLVDAPTPALYTNLVGIFAKAYRIKERL